MDLSPKTAAAFAAWPEPPFPPGAQRCIGAFCWNGMISVFEIFKIGIGPSSSHTIGPMKAAAAFAAALDANGARAKLTRLRVDLYGSLAWTGRGHASDKAVVLGLAGQQPDTVDPDHADRSSRRSPQAIGCRSAALPRSTSTLSATSPSTARRRRRATQTRCGLRPMTRRRGCSLRSAGARWAAASSPVRRTSAGRRPNRRACLIRSPMRRSCSMSRCAPACRSPTLSTPMNARFGPPPKSSSASPPSSPR